MIVLTYVDDCIIVSNSMDEIDDFVASISNMKPYTFQGNKITTPEKTSSSWMQATLTNSWAVTLNIMTMAALKCCSST